MSNWVIRRGYAPSRQRRRPDQVGARFITQVTVRLRVAAPGLRLPAALLGRPPASDDRVLRRRHRPRRRRSGSSSTAKRPAPKAKASAPSSARALPPYELPRLGKMSFENLPLRPALPRRRERSSSAPDDATPGQVYVYVGTKRTSGHRRRPGRADQRPPLRREGRRPQVREPWRRCSAGPDAVRSSPALGDVSSKSPGAQLEADSDATGVTEFLRPEDGALGSEPAPATSTS